VVGTWGSSIYGDPCRGCGFTWSTTVADGVVLVADLPATYGELLTGASGHERHPDLAWSVGAYVCHVGDNLRIWAERLAGIAAGAPPEVNGYDEMALDEARGYRSIPLPASLWSLTRSVVDWQGAVGRSRSDGVVLVHPERGGQSLSDVVLANAHDAFHHRWDIERSLLVGRS
jgi:hypothetical protein